MIALALDIRDMVLSDTVRIFLFVVPVYLLLRIGLCAEQSRPRCIGLYLPVVVNLLQLVRFTFSRSAGSNAFTSYTDYHTKQRLIAQISITLLQEDLLALIR